MSGTIEQLLKQRLCVSAIVAELVAESDNHVPIAAFETIQHASIQLVRIGLALLFGSSG
jgi:hypothetical protein